MLALVPPRPLGANQGGCATGHQQQRTGNVSASDRKPVPPDIIRDYRERKALQHAAIRGRRNPLDMGVSQARAHPCNALFITRNEQVGSSSALVDSPKSACVGQILEIRKARGDNPGFLTPLRG